MFLILVEHTRLSICHLIFRFILWESKGGQVFKTEQDSRIFSPKLRPVPFPSSVIRLEFIHDEVDYYTELDAVEVIG